MKPKPKHRTFLALVGSSLLPISTLHADDGTWTNVGGGTWSTATNWSGSTIADGAGFTANLTTNFNNNRTITIDNTSRTLGIVNIGDTGSVFYNVTLTRSGSATLTFDNGGSAAQLNGIATSGPANTLASALPVLLNDSLDIGNAAANALTVQGTINANSAGSKTISNVGSGAGLVTLSGAISDGSGTIAVNQNSATSGLFLSGTNNYTGGTTVTAGILTANTTGSLPGGTATVAGSATLAVRTGTSWNAAAIDTLRGAATWSATSSALGFDTTAGNFTYASNITEALSVNKLGSNTLTLSGTNSYSGNTIATVGNVVAAAPSALPGYDSPGRVIFNGGTVGIDLSGWSSTEIDSLLTNATKNSGALGLDTTTSGDTAQPSPFTSTALGSLAINKIGTNTLTLDQANTHTGPTIVSGGTLRLSHANAIASSSGLILRGGAVDLTTGVTLQSLTFDVNANQSVTGGALNFLPGGSILQNYNTVNGTITSTITGSPSVATVDGPSGGAYEGLKFEPAPGNTQTLGAVLNPNNTSTADKAGVYLGGSTTGNTVDSISYAGTDQYGTVYKIGTSTWTSGNITTGTLRIRGGNLVVNGTATGMYAGFEFASGGTLSGNASLRRNDRRGNVEFLSGFTLAPGNGVGTITVLDGTFQTPNAAQQFTIFRAGAIYEWEVGAASCDTVHIAAGKLQLDGFTLKIRDAGGAPANGTVQLPVFTYDPAKVTTRTLDLGSVVFDTSALDGSWTIGTLALTDDGAGTIYLTGLSKSEGSDPFDTWAATGTLGPVTFDGDANGDGVKDGLAFLLGAANPSENAIGRLPRVSKDGSGNLVMQFNCLPVAARGTATLKVAHSTNLAAWTATVDQVPDANDEVPDNNVTFVVGAGPAGPPATNNVTATINAAAAAGGKLFGRLEAME